MVCIEVSKGFEGFMSFFVLMFNCVLYAILLNIVDCNIVKLIHQFAFLLLSYILAKKLFCLATVIQDFLILPFGSTMSAYENVVGGKLKLKGKALDVKAAGVKKKKKKKNDSDKVLRTQNQELLEGWLFFAVTIMVLSPMPKIIHKYIE